MKRIHTSFSLGIVKRKFPVAAMVSATLLLGQSARAATATWNSATGSSWATTANWIGGSGTGNSPNASDNVILDNRNVTIPTTISLDGTETINDLTIGSSTGPALGAFTLEASASGTTAHVLNLEGGVLTLDASVTGTASIGNTTNGAMTIGTVAGGTFTIQNNNTTQTLNIVAGLIGTGSAATFDSAGGIIRLSGTNTATGAATYGNGTDNTLVQVGNVGAMGHFSSNTINAGSVVDLDGAGALSTTPFILNGAGFGSGADAGALVNSTGTASDAGTVTLASASTINNSGTLTLSGTITNGGFLLTLNGSGVTTLSNIVSGTGGLTMIGSGTLNLTAANTFSGGLTVANGTVVLTKSTDTSAITLGSSTGGSATLLASGNVVTYANTINLGTDAIGTLTLGNDGTGTTPIFSGAVALNGDTLTIASSGTAGSTQVSGIISGSGGLVINNGAAATAFLSGANTFTGGIDLTGGRLELGNNTALGASTNVLTIGAGTIIDSSSNTLSLTNPVTVLGSFTFGANKSVTINGALTMPAGDTTITVGTGGTSTGLVLTLGATSLGGSTLTVQGDIAAAAGTASDVTLGAISLTGNETFNVANSTAGNGTILTVGIISDGGSNDSVTKNGSGVLYLFGVGNTYGGGTTVNAGTLAYNSGDLASTTLGSGAITLDGGAFGRQDAGGAPSTLTNAINIGSGDTVDLFSASSSFTLGGALSLGSGATVVVQNPNANSVVVDISGPTSLGGNVTLNAVQAGLTVTSLISDAASTSNDGIIISSTGTGKVVTLNNGNSTFDGGVTLNSGSLALGGGSTLSGSAVTKGTVGTGTLTLNGGSIGFVAGGTPTINNTLVINGTVEFGGSTANGMATTAIVFGGATTIDAGSVLTSPTGATVNNSISFNSAVIPLSTVTLTGNITVEPSSGSTFIFDDVIGESVAGSGITIGNGTTTGTVVFGTNTNNPNTYTGATTVLSGTLQLEATGALQDSTLVTNSTAGSTVFDQSVVSHAFTIGGLSGNGNLALQDNAATPDAVALSAGNNNTSTTYSGSMSGSGSLNKIGSGELALTNTNTYTGGTIISAGNLAVDNSSGSGTGSGAVQVNGGALGGTGTINTSGVTSGKAIDIAANAMLSPSNGTTTGFSHLNLTLQTGTSVTLEAGAKLAFNLGASTATSDEVLITGGTLALNNQSFSDFTFNAQGTIAPGLYTLIDSTGGITGSLATTLGTFDDGLYSGQLILTGDDLELQVSDAEAIPEPGTWALMLGGLALLVVIQRRKNKLV